MKSIEELLYRFYFLGFYENRDKTHLYNISELETEVKKKFKKELKKFRGDI